MAEVSFGLWMKERQAHFERVAEDFKKAKNDSKAKMTEKEA